MQVPITVGIGESNDELLVLLATFGIVGGIAFEGFLALPEGLDGDFVGEEGVALGGSFGRAGEGEGGHFGGGGGVCCCCHCLICVLREVVLVVMKKICLSRMERASERGEGE